MSEIQAIVNKIRADIVALHKLILDTQENGLTAIEIQDLLSLKANIDSPALTGVPNTTFPSINDNSARIAPTSFVWDHILGQTPRRRTIVNSGSLNHLIVPGFYSSENDASVTNVTGLPSDYGTNVGFVLQVFTGGPVNGRFIQILRRRTEPARCWVRQITEAFEHNPSSMEAWSAWERLPTMADIASIRATLALQTNHTSLRAALNATVNRPVVSGEIIYIRASWSSGTINPMWTDVPPYITRNTNSQGYIVIFVESNASTLLGSNCSLLWQFRSVMFAYGHLDFGGSRILWSEIPDNRSLLLGTNHSSLLTAIQATINRPVISRELIWITVSWSANVLNPIWTDLPPGITASSVVRAIVCIVPENSANNILDTNSSIFWFEREVRVAHGRISSSGNIHWEQLARLRSPAFTENPTAPTQATDENSTRLATTAYVKNNIVDNLTSSNVNRALSARRGRDLQDSKLNNRTTNIDWSQSSFLNGILSACSTFGRTVNSNEIIILRVNRSFDDVPNWTDLPHGRDWYRGNLIVYPEITMTSPITTATPFQGHMIYTDRFFRNLAIGAYTSTMPSIEWRHFSFVLSPIFLGTPTIRLTFAAGIPGQPGFSEWHHFNRIAVVTETTDRMERYLPVGTYVLAATDWAPAINDLIGVFISSTENQHGYTIGAINLGIPTGNVLSGCWRVSGRFGNVALMRRLR